MLITHLKTKISLKNPQTNTENIPPIHFNFQVKRAERDLLSVHLLYNGTYL